MTQILEEHYFTKGRVIVRGQTFHRGEAKKADYILFFKPNIPLAVIEAKDNNHAVGDGMQQALDYAETLDLPFAYSSNGDAFLEHDRTPGADPVEREVPHDQFPSPEQRRIVAKVDQLMALVDELEKQLATSRTTAKKLLEALVAELTVAGVPVRRGDAYGRFSDYTLP